MTYTLEDYYGNIIDSKEDVVVIDPSSVEEIIFDRNDLITTSRRNMIKVFKIKITYNTIYYIGVVTECEIKFRSPAPYTGCLKRMG